MQPARRFWEAGGPSICGEEGSGSWVTSFLSLRTELRVILTRQHSGEVKGTGRTGLNSGSATHCLSDLELAP